MMPLARSDRSADSLLLLIKQQIETGTIICGDGQIAYRNEKDHGYEHLIINLVDPHPI